MLGRLAKYLRALGYDTIYCRLPAEAFVREAEAEGRVFVTLRRALPDGCRCRMISPGEGPIEIQLRKIIESLRLKPDRDRVLTICLNCNVETREVPLDTIAERIPEKVREKVSSYRMCPKCGKIFWWGSHADRIMGVLQRSGAFGSPEP
jgi:hypothetical protein